jgi:hypothetical protein
VGHEFIPKGDPIEGLRAAVQLCDVGWSGWLHVSYHGQNVGASLVLALFS